MILYGRNDFLESEVGKDLSRRLITSQNDRFLWPIDAILRTPHIDLIKLHVENITQYFINLYSDIIDNKNDEIVVAMTHSKSGNSSYSKFSLSDNNAAHVVIFDLRLCYEIMAYIYTSPLQTGDYSCDLTTSIMKLSLASRLSARERPSLQRFVIGLTAVSPIYGFTSEISEQLPKNLQHLELQSGFSKQDIKTAIVSTVLFILCHEFAHAVFDTSREIKEEISNEIHRVIKDFSNDRKHIAEHDIQEIEEIYKSDVDIKNFEIFGHRAMLEEVSIREENIENILRAGDHEELMADLYAMLIIEPYLPRLVADSARLINVFRYTLNSLARINYTMSRNTILFEYVDNIIVNSMPDCQEFNSKDIVSAIQEHMSAHSKTIDRSFGARNTLFMKFIDGSIARSHKKENEQDILEKINILFDQVNNIAQKWISFELGNQKIMTNSVENIESLIKISSRGRAIQCLFPGDDTKYNLSKSADPFSFYLFGWGPLAEIFSKPHEF